MNSSESIKELAEALASAQAELKPAPFDKENEFAGYKYASLNSVIEVAKKVLPKYGLSVSQVPVYETVDEMYYAGVETTLMHKSGEWISERLLVPVVSHGRLIELTIATDQKGKQSLGKTNVVQEMGKVITYCRRYAYAAIIGISSDEDTDGGEVKGRASVENEQQKVEQVSHQKTIEEINKSLGYEEEEDEEQEEPKTGGFKAYKPRSGAPLEPDKLVEALHKKAAGLKNEVTAKQLSFASRLIDDNVDKTIPGTSAKVKQFLTGEQHLSRAEPSLVVAILDWLNPDPVNFQIDPIAKQELDKVVSRVNEGQPSII